MRLMILTVLLSLGCASAPKAAPTGIPFGLTESRAGEPCGTTAKGESIYCMTIDEFQRALNEVAEYEKQWEADHDRSN